MIHVGLTFRWIIFFWSHIARKIGFTTSIRKFSSKCDEEKSVSIFELLTWFTSAICVLLLSGIGSEFQTLNFRVRFRVRLTLWNRFQLWNPDSAQTTGTVRGPLQQWIVAPVIMARKAKMIWKFSSHFNLKPHACRFKFSKQIVPPKNNLPSRRSAQILEEVN